MTLITITDVNAIVLRNGKVGTEAECLCRCCACSECECEVEVTYGGITFPADGLPRTLCIYNDGMPNFFGMQSNKLWYQGPYVNVNFGVAGMLSVTATLVCCPVSGGGSACTSNQFRVQVVTQYTQIIGIGNVEADAFPNVGDLCGNWGPAGLALNPIARVFEFLNCDDCGCPTNEQPIRVDEFDFSVVEIKAGVECLDEYAGPKQTTPVFSIDCEPCS